MKLLVCISHVPDTTTKIKFNSDATLFDGTGVQWVINPWDELALTRAVELKEDLNARVSEVTVITVGDVSTEPTLRKCLAIGADKAVRIDTIPGDAYSTAVQLAVYADDKAYDFIICGIESGDYNEASVGGMLSEILDYPSVSSVSSIRFDADGAIIQRDIANGKEELVVQLPAVLIVQKGFARVPRIPNMRGIMTARSKPLEVFPAKPDEKLVSFIGYSYPKYKKEVTMIDPDNISDLVTLLNQEAKVI